MEKTLRRLREIDGECHLLEGVNALLGWDQETYMPPGGIDARGEQIALIQGLSHDRLVSPELSGLLADLGVSESNPMGDPGLPEIQRRYLRCFHRVWSRAVKLPGEFVRERAKAQALSQAAWVDARARDDFGAFEPHLAKMFDFSRREAAYRGYGAKPYDGILDAFEPGLTAAQLSAVFAPLKQGLVGLLGKIRSRPQVDDSALRRHCPAERQEAFSRRVMALMSFDAEHGRLDRSAHPFTTTVGTGDVRITTRYLEDNLGSSVSSTIHETGHALYELGLPREWARTAMGEACSTAVHESQSRFWENIVGKSLPFWRGQYAALRSDLAPALDDLPLEGFYRGLNKVESSLIRVDADEVTYSLHVILRFDLESRLMAGSLDVKDIPRAWNESMESLLGIRPPNDRAGCLQDIHWAIGLIGYFPGYALGNLYSAQFAAAMRRELGDLDADVARGDFSRMLSWLRANIHERGSSLTPSELVSAVTGSALSPAAFLSYLSQKYAGIYGF
jgi:carboxypeptidase Taq